MLNNGAALLFGMLSLAEASEPLLASAFLDTFPEYTGDLVVRGSIIVLPGLTARVVTLRGFVSGLEKDTQGGLHIHEGTSCAYPGAHFVVYEDGECGGGQCADPWESVEWSTISRTARCSGSFNENEPHSCAVHFSSSVSGFTLEGPRSVIGRAVVVHDSKGEKVGCGIIKREVVSAPKVAMIAQVQGSAARATGLLEVYQVKEGIRILGSVTGPRNALLNVAVHEGSTCAALGDRYYEGNYDPWKYTMFQTDGEGNAKLNRTVNGFTMNGVHAVDGRVVVFHDSEDTAIGCGKIGEASAAHAASAFLDSSPSYTGPLVVRGVIVVLPSQKYPLTGITLRGYITGLPEVSSGGLHIHEGTSCASVGSHYRILSSYGKYTDPWKKVGWESIEDNLLSKSCGDACAVHFNYNIDGFTLDGSRPVVRRVVNVHDNEGNSIACGVIEPEDRRGPKVAVVSPLEGSGSKVTGMLEILGIKEGIRIEGVLDGLEASTVQSIAVHSGSTCGERGERYFDGAFDPWKHVTCTSDERGSAKLNVTVKGFTFDGVHPVLGKVVVVYNSKDVEVGCGKIGSAYVAPPDVPTATLTVDEDGQVLESSNDELLKPTLDDLDGSKEAAAPAYQDTTATSYGAGWATIAAVWFTFSANF